MKATFTPVFILCRPLCIHLLPHAKKLSKENILTLGISHHIPGFSLPGKLCLMSNGSSCTPGCSLTLHPIDMHKQLLQQQQQQQRGLIDCCYMCVTYNWCDVLLQMPKHAPSFTLKHFY